MKREAGGETLCEIRLILHPSLKSTFQGLAIRVFKVAADWDAAGDAGDFEVGALNTPEDVGDGGFAFNG